MMSKKLRGIGWLALGLGLAQADPAPELLRWGPVTEMPPLDAPRIWARHPAPVCGTCTANVLALVFQNTGPSLVEYPWPLFVFLDTAHTQGDATALQGRLKSRDRGWAAVFHGEAEVLGPGATVIGANLEMTTKTPGAQVYGIVIQGKGGVPGTAGLKAQEDWHTAIDLSEARSQVGIQMGDSPLCWAGQEVCLRRKGNKVVLTRRGKVVPWP